jgi:hypothetical protein
VTSLTSFQRNPDSSVNVRLAGIVILSGYSILLIYVTEASNVIDPTALSTDAEV